MFARKPPGLCGIKVVGKSWSSGCQCNSRSACSPSGKDMKRPCSSNCQISRYQVDGVRLPPQGKSQDGMILVRDGKTYVFFLGDQWVSQGVWAKTPDSFQLREMLKSLTYQSTVCLKGVIRGNQVISSFGKLWKCLPAGSKTFDQGFEWLFLIISYFIWFNLRERIHFWFQRCSFEAQKNSDFSQRRVCDTEVRTYQRSLVVKRGKRMGFQYHS